MGEGTSPRYIRLRIVRSFKVYVKTNCKMERLSLFAHARGDARASREGLPE
jgi:hypothetical protein